MSTRKGQIWSIDYTLAMLLFLIAIIIGIKILANTFGNQQYLKLQENAERITDQLTGEGYLTDWPSTQLFQIGLTTRNNVNMTKLRALYNMDYSKARNHLMTMNNYYIFLEDKDHGIVHFNNSCGYGNDDVKNTGTVRYWSVAYYFPQSAGDTYLRDYMAKSYNMSYYYRNAEPGVVIDNYVMNGSLYNLTQNIDLYNTIIFENPSFDTFSGGLALTRLSEILEEWVSKGNLLILTGRIGLDSLTRASFPLIEDGAGNATIQNEHHDIWFSAGEQMLFSRKYAVVPLAGIDNYLMIANYTNGHVGMAAWDYGEGKVFYFADVVANYDMQANISLQINHTVARTALGYCEGLEGIEANNLVKVDRFVVFNNKITKLTLYLWN